MRLLIICILFLYCVGATMLINEFNNYAKKIRLCLNGNTTYSHSLEFTCQLTEKQVKLNQLEEEKRKLLEE